MSRGAGGPGLDDALPAGVAIWYEVTGKRFQGSRVAESPGPDRGAPGLRRRRWSVTRAEARWRCATTRNDRMSRCSNRGRLPAGSSKRRSGRVARAGGSHLLQRESRPRIGVRHPSSAGAEATGLPAPAGQSRAGSYLCLILLALDLAASRSGLWGKPYLVFPASNNRDLCAVCVLRQLGHVGKERIRLANEEPHGC